MPTVSGRKMHGQHGAVFIQGFAAASNIPTSLVNLAVKKWEATYVAKEHDVGSTSVWDWESFQKGKAHLEFTIDAQLDISQLPTNNAGLQIVQGDYVQCQLVQDQSTGGTAGGSTPGQIMWDFTGIASNVKVTTDNAEIITFTITGKSTGTVKVNNGS